MPITEHSSTEILFKSQPYFPRPESKRRVCDQMAITFNPVEGDWEIEIYEGNGSGRKSMIVVLSEELHALADAIRMEVRL